MIESILITIVPVAFLILLFGGGALFKRQNIDQDGEAPISKTLFYASKYSVLVLWGAMVLQVWGIGISLIAVPAILRWIAMLFWFFGFALLFLGRFELGTSFRLGTARESANLRVEGLYRISRNPMYLGIYATILASALYTMSPLVIALGIFVAAVHHRITLAEENHMQKVFGKEYEEYCHRVRRYI
ncbi:methyltransferase family protein [Methanoculleus sp.]|uniref:methyltransferase family protein n=1 Tax=Methanoculleus sp. TaxID=90427 RepID=UPI002FC5B683